MRNTAPTAYTAVPTVVTIASGHDHRNQRSRCRNPSGHVRRNVGHDPGITGHVGPEYSVIEEIKSSGPSASVLNSQRTLFVFVVLIHFDQTLCTRCRALCHFE